jgi:hypothetical protein
MPNPTPSAVTSPSDADLQAEIDVLRVQYPETQALYREVCVLLFFRHGITPTANRLYQLVRKGSMSAPAEALTRFWATLRDKSRIRIEHPDLPPSLQDTAGEMMAALWQRAQVAALEAVESLQNDAKARGLAADVLVHAAQQRGTVLEQKLTQAELSRTQGESVALQRQVDAQAGERQTLVDGFNAAQQRLTHELMQQRAIALAAESRHAEDLKRVLLDIDRERGNVLKGQRDLEQARRTHASDNELHRQQALQQQAVLDSLRQRHNELEGHALALREQLQQRLEEIEVLRANPAPATAPVQRRKAYFAAMPTARQVRRRL